MKSLNSYLKRAWSDLTADDSWWKVIFAFGLLNCVPIVGQVFLCGYLSDWAKEAAWGMRTGLPHQLGDIGRRGKYGLITVGVLLIWTVPVFAVAQLLRLVPVAGDFLCFIFELLIIVVGGIAGAAAIRSIIYERVMPGLQIGRILKMVMRDPGGLAQVFAIILLDLVLLVAALFVVFLPTIPFINVIASSTTTSILGTDLALVVGLGMLTIVVALVVWVTGAVVSALISALYIRSLGYWMEQFEPAKWKSPADPMPFETEEAKAKAAKTNDADAERPVLNDQADSQAAPEIHTQEMEQPDDH
jgi:hypothetical protein